MTLAREVIWNAKTALLVDCGAWPAAPRHGRLGAVPALRHALEGNEERNCGRLRLAEAR